MPSRVDEALANRRRVRARRQERERQPGDDQAPPVFVRPLPEDCPVQPLGHAGGTNYFIDAAGQLVAVPDEKLVRTHLLGLFGDASYLWANWPRRTDGVITGWRPEQVAETLRRECHVRSVIDVAERVRGRGGWRSRDGDLLMHLGDVIATGLDAEGKVIYQPPGELDGVIYPRAAPLPRVWPDRVPADKSPAHGLLALFKTWNWARGDLDALLLLGWLVASLCGAALKYRPVAWVTGGYGSGKTTLVDRLLKAACGPALLSVADASEAGIRQTLRSQTIGVAVDEQEADEDMRRGQALIRLARLAASGALMVRGGGDHDPREFTARSSFLFSSIVIPPLSPQDRSRMAILSLMPLGNATEPKLDPELLKTAIPMLRRRLFDNWERFEGVCETARAALHARGHDARGCDVFGTLIACADVALHDLPSSDRDAGDHLNPEALAERLKASSLAERIDVQSDERAMIKHLLSRLVDPFRKGPRLVGEWLAKGVREIAAEQKSLDFGDEENERQENDRLAQIALQRIGLKLHRDPEGALWLAIANSHSELGHLFMGTHWATSPGKSAPWVQAARRIPGFVVPQKPLWFVGGAERVTLLPIIEVMPGMPDDLRRAIGLPIEG